MIVYPFYASPCNVLSISKRRRLAMGITMLELIVVVGIISVLVSLSLVGVMYARESARKVQCQNNLRQIGVSMNMIMDRKNRVPGLGAFEVPPKYTGSETMVGNPFVGVAVEMLFSCVAVNNEIRCDSMDRGESFPPSPLRCPSADQRLGYRLNCGSDPLYNLRREPDTTPLFSRYKMAEKSSSAISDGLSNTVMLSERYSHDGSKRFPQAIARASSSDPVNVQNDCADAVRQGLVSGRVGRWWEFQIYECGYSHCKQPNASEYDCVAAMGGMPPTGLMMYVASRSNHSGGVFSTLFDGSVRWVDSNIDVKIWKALGTHNGSEVISD